HLFWIFGHPEVYVLIFPAFAILSEVIPVFSRKPLFGRPAMVGAVVAIGFISLGVWAHHMFTVGMTSYANTFFAASTMLVGIPTGIKIFNWTATMYGGKITFRTPMLFCCAFLLQFLVAGLTGIMLATAPFDWQLNNSYFLIAHFHFTLLLGLVFGLFAGMYYWFPKVSGRMYSETLGKWHFWLFVIGANLTFIPLHVAGWLGMPRRIYTYPPGRGWEIWNLLASIGVFFQSAGILTFVVNVVKSSIRGEPAGDDPWDAWTLEWATTSPPAEYNFEKLPVVRSARPLWDLKHPQDPDWKYE
ncbi:MAG: cbb3-type cytochrome c oxidase subunit I, partial [Acidobacteriaceae bacterium]|nr:cbb3-type cytochrome c oxidase subunit I [Acidobacteriaceae bacterium]